MTLQSLKPTAVRSSTVVLAIILAAQLMAVLDASVVIAALPAIHRSLGFSATGLSWVQNAYMLPFGGLLLLGARAGDVLGRRRVFIAGLALFTFASLMGGLAQSPAWLIAARAVQGLAAAVAVPATLTLLMVTFHEGPARLRAVSLYGAISGAAGSVGIVLGGILTSALSWRWGLFINVPIGIAAVALAPRFLPDTPRDTKSFDVTGAVTGSLGMFAIVYGFVRAGTAGWGDSVAVASFVGGLLLLGGLILTELRARHPMMPLHLFANVERSGALVSRLFLVAGMYSTFYFLTQFFQGVLGFSAIEAGFAFLPMTALVFTMARVVPRLAPRVGTTRLLIAGMVVDLCGMVWLRTVSAGTHYFPEIAIPLLFMGAGAGVCFIVLTGKGIQGVSDEDAGAASGLVNVFHQVGGCLGIAVLTTLFVSATRSATGPAKAVLAHGISVALTGGTVSIVLALVVTLVTTRRQQPAVILSTDQTELAETVAA
ncbi:MAG TPA: MFS transporter [Acidimicrobiales bacterium]|jgi:EmrB/QacA subfamily drug resistance transporter|nr:MFS transporter [Acidimicrobiales bacterium]